MREPRDLMTLDEAARRLGVSKTTVLRRCAEAGIQGPRPAKQVMLTEADYDRLVDYLRTRRDPRAGRPGRQRPMVAGAPNPAPNREGAPLRGVYRRQTQRLLDGVRSGKQPVVALDLERK
jgi:excisionase family DNA binding protein